MDKLKLEPTASYSMSATCLIGGYMNCKCLNGISTTQSIFDRINVHRYLDGRGSVTHIPLALFVGCIGQQVVWFGVRHADVVNNSQKTAAYQFDTD